MNTEFQAKYTPVLQKMGSLNYPEAMLAQDIFAQAVTLPLKEGIQAGYTLDGIFQSVPIANGITAEWPIDLLAPGTEKEHIAYTIPNQGYIPQKSVESDYVTVPTYEVGNSIDMLLKYARDARWDVVGRALQVMEAGFWKKMSDDGFHLLLAAGVDRNIVIYDSDASAGILTKRLISLMQIAMRRNGGGNSTSVNRGKLTDIFLSPECIEDIRNWNIDQLDEVSRREIYLAPNDRVVRIFGVTLHDMDELGDGQEYQNYYTGDLGATLGPSSDTELLLGLDLSKGDSFVMPSRNGGQVEVTADNMLHRQRRMGWYAWTEYGFGVLDNRRVILGSA